MPREEQTIIVDLGSRSYEISIVSQQLGSYLVSPAAWQNYLQCQDHGEEAVANCNFAALQVME